MESEKIQKESKKINVPYACKPRQVRCCLTPIGEAVLPQNDYFVEDGKQKAKPGKGIDLKPYLKASQASTDLANIVARLKAGDESVVNVRADGIEGDLVGMPNSVNDVKNLAHSLHKNYLALPDEVKKLYPSEIDFYEACLTGTLKKSEVKEVVPDEKPEVKEVFPEVKPEEKE